MPQTIKAHRSEHLEPDRTSAIEAHRGGGRIELNLNPWELPIAQTLPPATPGKFRHVFALLHPTTLDERILTIGSTLTVQVGLLCIVKLNTKR